LCFLWASFDVSLFAAPLFPIFHCALSHLAFPPLNCLSLLLYLVPTPAFILPTFLGFSAPPLFVVLGCCQPSLAHRISFCLLVPSSYPYLTPFPSRCRSPPRSNSGHRNPAILFTALVHLSSATSKRSPSVNCNKALQPLL
jgi:hypothetical protein